jgi:hypothetical protein
LLEAFGYALRFRVDSDRHVERLVSWTHGGMSHSAELNKPENLMVQLSLRQCKPPHRAFVSAVIDGVKCCSVVCDVTLST